MCMLRMPCLQEKLYGLKPRCQDPDGGSSPGFLPTCRGRQVALSTRYADRYALQFCSVRFNAAQQPVTMHPGSQGDDRVSCTFTFSSPAWLDWRSLRLCLYATAGIGFLVFSVVLSGLLVAASSHAATVSESLEYREQCGKISSLNYPHNKAKLTARRTQVTGNLPTPNTTVE